MPMSERSSSTMRAMAVRLIITATSRNTIGNALPSDWMESRSDLSALNPPSDCRSCTYQRTCGMLVFSSFSLVFSVCSVLAFCSFNCDCAWSSCCLACVSSGLAAMMVSRIVSRVVSSSWGVVAPAAAAAPAFAPFAAAPAAAAPACMLTIWSTCWLNCCRFASICDCASANFLSASARASAIFLLPASSSSCRRAFWRSVFTVPSMRSVTCLTVFSYDSSNVLSAAAPLTSSVADV